MEFNINDKIKTKLTKDGEDLLKLNSRPSYDYNYNKETMILDEQLWVIMNTFGEHTFNGGKNYFVNNIFYIGE